MPQMHQLVKQPVKTYKIPENWAEEDSFTRDQLFDSYLKGKQDGKEEWMQVLSKQFKDNMNTAASISEKLFKAISEKNIKLEGIHLRADSITKFTSLFVVNPKTFISPKFREVFIIARKIKREIENENFYISFLFMPNSKEINYECIRSDGYFLRYEKKSRKT